MGFEIIFYYKSKGSENIESKTMKIGTPEEEVSLEAVAGKIFAQLARRNILVTDVEIYEFTKKRLNYKETSDGILIKNRKFKFDDGGHIVAAEEPVEQDRESLEKLLEAIANNPDLAGILQRKVKEKETSTSTSDLPHLARLPHESIKKDKILRKEIFNPPQWLLTEAIKRGIKFTIGKQYPILSEKVVNTAVGIDYTTINNDGEKQILSSLHFIPVPVQLEGRFMEGQSTGQGHKLSWEGVVDDGAINLR